METITGFKVSIEIHCETENEIVAHLHAIKSNLLKHLRRKDVAGEITVVPLKFEDNNCYGHHDVVIDFDHSTR